jgi:apolipoprotein N-acyltransferase
VNIFKLLAKQLKIYLVTTPYVVTGATAGKSENKILFFSPEGNLVLTHYKYGGNFMEGTVQGNKEIKTVTTEYGNLSAIICWDADFPSIVKQVGKSGTSILFVPASDWEEIDPAHSIVTIFRGIENGCSVVRQTRNGLSVMTDPAGRIIAQMDHFKNSAWVTVGQVPTKKWFTVYPVIGDLFGWLSLIGLLFFIILQKRKK